MLDAHPNICCPNWEVGLFLHFKSMIEGDLANHLRRENELAVTRTDVVSWMRRSFDDLMQDLTKPAKKPRWAEKTPGHVFCMNLITEVYPESQFIHIIRDGRQVIRSLQNMSWAPQDITWSCNRWVNSICRGREAGMTLPPTRYVELRYENLISHPESELRVLCDFLGERYSESMLAFHKPENNSWGIARQAVQKKAVNKGKYRELNRKELQVMKKIASELLDELGYSPRDNGTRNTGSSQ